MNQPRRHRVKLRGQVLQLRSRQRRFGWLLGPLAPNEAALVSLYVVAILLALNGLVWEHSAVVTLLIAAAAGALLRLYAWLRIAGGRR